VVAGEGKLMGWLRDESSTDGRGGCVWARIKNHQGGWREERKNLIKGGGGGGSG
jgi:hypothetical protein